MAGAAGVCRSTTSSRPTTSASTRRRAWRTSASRRSTCSSSTSGPTSGRPTIAGSARLRALKDEGLVQRPRHQRQPLAAGQRAARARDRADRLRCRWSTTSSTRAPKTSCSRTAPEARDRHHRRVPFDEGSLTGTLTADDDLADGRLPQSLLQPREPAATLPRVDRAAARRSGRDVDAASSRCGTSWPTRPCRP